MTENVTERADGALVVSHEPERSRYVLAERGEEVGELTYRRTDDALVLSHTGIAPARRGAGLGAVLVQGALDHLRGDGKRIVPSCWYVAEFIQLHPEYRDLLADR